ncbi:MAG: endospore germination permease [Clostridiaceae bacterium]
MSKEIITKKQAISTFILFTFGTNLILGTGLAAKKDAYIAIIFSMIISLPLILIYYKTLELFPGKDIFQIINLVFGKILSKVIILLYIWFTLHLASILLKLTINFINTVGLFYTPNIIISFVICFLIAFSLKKGIETLGRWSEFFVLVVIFFLLFIFLLFIPSINLDYIKPILYDNINNLDKAILITISYPFSQYFFFTFLGNNFDKKQNIKKIFFSTFLISGFILSFTMFIIATILPESKLSSLYFVFYAAVRLLKITDFIERIEILVTLIFLVGIFIKMSIFLLGTLKGIQSIFNLDSYHSLIIPIVALTFNISLILYDSIMETSEFATETYPYYSIPFQIIIPIFIYIVAKIRYKKISP